MMIYLLNNLINNLLNNLFNNPIILSLPTTGKHCEQDINMCELNNPCKNHGKTKIPILYHRITNTLNWIQQQTNYYLNYYSSNRTITKTT